MEKLLENKKQHNKPEYTTSDDKYSRIAIIDADSIPYKVAYTSNDLYTAFLLIHNILSTILKDTMSSHFILFHTTKCNFRHDLIDNYKDNRKELVKSPFYYEVRDMMITLYNSTAYGCYEADDLVAMVHRKFGVYKSVLCSPDKDLKQVYPARIYNYNKRIITNVDEPIGELTAIIKQKKQISKKTGKPLTETKVKGHGTKFLFWQLLAGDPGDFIKGVPGCGSKTAYNILKDLTTLESMYDACKNTYIEWYNKDYNKRKKQAVKTNEIFDEKYDIQNAIDYMKTTFRLLYMQQHDQEFRIPKPINLKDAYEYL